MSTQTSFTSEEWQTLQRAPLWVLTVVGGSDRKVDKKELEAFVKEIQEASLYKGGLVREVLMSLVSGFNEIFKDFAAILGSQPDLLASLGEIADIIESKATPDEAQNFKGAMLLLGNKIAHASGGGLFGLGSKVSEIEKKGLAVLALGLRAEGTLKGG